jgi:hypothetical protein
MGARRMGQQVVCGKRPPAAQAAGPAGARKGICGAVRRARRSSRCFTCHRVGLLGKEGGVTLTSEAGATKGRAHAKARGDCESEGEGRAPDGARPHVRDTCAGMLTRTGQRGEKVATFPRVESWGRGTARDKVRDAPLSGLPTSAVRHEISLKKHRRPLWAVREAVSCKRGKCAGHGPPGWSAPSEHASANRARAGAPDAGSAPVAAATPGAAAGGQRRGLNLGAPSAAPLKLLRKCAGAA